MNAKNSAVVAAAAPVVTTQPARLYDIDSAHSSAQFKVRHLMVSHVRGELGTVQGTVTVDDVDPSQSRVDVRIDARALDSREPKRDEHLRSADFLDVANHPFVTFRSTTVKAAGAGDLLVTGDLTIRGITRPVTLKVESLSEQVQDPWGNTKRGATARTMLNRKDWGLTWNVALEAGGVLVADRVDVEIEVELVARKADAT